MIYFFPFDALYHLVFFLTELTVSVNVIVFWVGGKNMPNWIIGAFVLLVVWLGYRLFTRGRRSETQGFGSRLDPDSASMEDDDSEETLYMKRATAQPPAVPPVGDPGRRSRVYHNKPVNNDPRG